MESSKEAGSARQHDWLGSQTLAGDSSWAARQRMVDYWLIDVRRRGAKLYSVNRSRAIVHLSFLGKDRLRYNVKINLDSQDIRIELNRSEWKWVKCERYLLSAGSLRLLAKRICPLPEGDAVVRVDLLARLSLLCAGYRRLLQQEYNGCTSQASTKSFSEIESELQQKLLPEEREITDNPFLQLPLGP